MLQLNEHVLDNTSEELPSLIQWNSYTPPIHITLVIHRLGSIRHSVFWFIKPRTFSGRRPTSSGHTVITPHCI